VRHVFEKTLAVRFDRLERDDLREFILENSRPQTAMRADIDGEAATRRQL